MEPAAKKPVVYMFAGPNGAGKSSIYEASNKEFSQVNADVIQKENPDYTQRRAGIEAGRRIEELLKAGVTFSTENNLYKKKQPQHHHPLPGSGLPGRSNLCKLGVRRAMPAAGRPAGSERGASDTGAADSRTLLRGTGHHPGPLQRDGQAHPTG